MKSKIFLLASFALLGIFSCNEAAKTNTAAAPDYAALDKKVEVVRAFIKAHNDEDLAAIANLLADTAKYSPSVYNGNQWVGKTEMLAAMKSYHDNFENLSYAEGIVTPDSTDAGFYSGAVYPEQTATANNMPVAIRTYGTWTGVESKSKQAVSIKYYGLIYVNNDGKIVRYSDYFDTSEISNLLSKSASTQ